MDALHLCTYPPTAAQKEAIKLASESDRRWFVAHPERNHRLRRAVFAEAPAHPDLLTFVLVKQIEPGVRARAVIYAASVPPCEPNEAEAAWAWREVLGG